MTDKTINDDRWHVRQDNPTMAAIILDVVPEVRHGSIVISVSGTRCNNEDAAKIRGQFGKTTPVPWDLRSWEGYFSFRFMGGKDKFQFHLNGDGSDGFWSFATKEQVWAAKEREMLDLVGKDLKDPNNWGQQRDGSWVFSRSYRI